MVGCRYPSPRSRAGRGNPSGTCRAGGDDDTVDRGTIALGESSRHIRASPVADDLAASGRGRQPFVEGALFPPRVLRRR